MDHKYGSEVALIGSSDDYPVKVKVVKHAHKSAIDKKRNITKAERQKRSEICETIKLCYHVSIALLLISITVIVAVYISHLQDHVQNLDARVRDQDVKIRDQDAKFGDQDARIIALDAKVRAQEATIRDQEARLSDQDAKLRDQAARITSLDAKVSDLGVEKRSADFSQHGDISNLRTDDLSHDTRELSSVDRVKIRTRRDTTTSSCNADDDLASETPHHKRRHHGIGADNIGYIYADPKLVRDSTSTGGFIKKNINHMRTQCGELYENADSHYYCTKTHARLVDRYMTSNQKLRFTPVRRRGKRVSGCDNGQIRKNGYRNVMLCKQPHEKQKDTLMITRDNHKFRYFSEAPWMNQDNLCSNFIMNRTTGDFIVKKSGTYIIHSNIHFTDKSDEPHYGVYREGADDPGDTELISKCQVSQTDKEGSGVFPCPTWQLMPLKANDKIYMQISGYNWFRIEKETFHLALIRLNSWHEIDQ